MQYAILDLWVKLTVSADYMVIMYQCYFPDFDGCTTVMW